MWRGLVNLSKILNHCLRSFGKSRLVLVSGPVFLLAIEVIILTPLVEFGSGWMAYLANPKLCSALFLAMALFILLSISDLELPSQGRNPKYAILWFFMNIGCFYYLIQLSLKLLASDRKEGIAWFDAVGWLTVVSLTGISAILTFLPLSSIIAWIQHSWHKAVGALVLAINFVLLVPDIQKIWNVTHPSTIAMAAEMLESCGRKAEIGLARMHNPRLGIQGKGTRLIVTRYCAEMESLATFLFIALVLCIAYLSRIRWLPWLTIVCVGLGSIYFLNAIRIAALVEIAGTWGNPQLAVNLAHSRLSGIFFLGFSIVLLIVTRGWWCPPPKNLETR